MRRRDLLSAAVIGGAAVLLPSQAHAAGDDQGFNDIATRYLADRAGRVTSDRSGSAPADGLVTGAQRSLFAGNADRLEFVRGRLADLHGGYSRSATTARIDQATVTGSLARLKVTERTKLFFVDRSADVDHTAYEASHELELHRSGGKWLIGSATYLPADPYSTPVTQFTDELPARMQEARAAGSAKVAPGRKTSSSEPLATRYVETKAGTSGGVSTMAGYNYTAMVNYARAWAFGVNTAYPTYAPDRDCTNFTSQCLHQGGWQLVTGYYKNNNVWWYNSLNKSYTWGGSENWYEFAINNSYRTHLLDSIYQLLNGDILQYDYGNEGIIDHNQICTGNLSGTPLMTQHSGTNYRDKPLNEIMWDGSNANAWKYAHRT